jgi:ribosomal-protein-alanine N-acetyltransferase
MPRWMNGSDLDAVLDIERDSFQYPWTKKSFVECLESQNVIARVVEHHETIVGFVVYSFHQKWIEIRNIAVISGERQQGFGSILVDATIPDQQSWGRRTEVRIRLRESNLRALRFFKTCEFSAYFLDREYYDDGEDSILMRYVNKCIAVDDYPDDVIAEMAKQAKKA